MKPTWKSLGNGTYRITADGWWCDVKWMDGAYFPVAGNGLTLTSDEVAAILES